MLHLQGACTYAYLQWHLYAYTKLYRCISITKNQSTGVKIFSLLWCKSVPVLIMHANTEIHKVLLWPFWEPDYTNTSNMLWQTIKQKLLCLNFTCTLTWNTFVLFHSLTSSSLKCTAKVTKYEQVNNLILTCLMIFRSILLILLQQYHVPVLLFSFSTVANILKWYILTCIWQQTKSILKLFDDNLQ